MDVAHPTQTQGSPQVSVIIPCRNEIDHIEACLRSVLSQEAPPGGFEVLIADGLSTDGTRQKILDIAQSDSRVRLIDNPQRIVPTGLNRAIRAARGRVIIRKDAHTEYPSDYIRRCLATLEKTGADNVGGIWEIVPVRPTLMARAIAAVQGHRFGVGNARFRTRSGGIGPADTVPYGCFPREVFERVGYFDERLIRGQDLELNARIRRRGGLVLLDPAIHCFYHPPSTLGDFAKKQFRNGLWVIYQAAYTSISTLSARHLVPLAFVAALMLGGMLSIVFPRVGLALVLGALLPYGLLALVVSWLLARSGPKRAFFLYPFLLFCNHIAYGLGSLWGLLTVWKCRATKITTPGPISS